MDEKILSRIVDILNEHGIDIGDMSFDEDLEMDSIQYISIIVSLEEAFDISIVDENLINYGTSIKNFYDIVFSLGERRKGLSNTEVIEKS